jgi:hypothetical protein
MKFSFNRESSFQLINVYILDPIHYASNIKNSILIEQWKIGEKINKKMYNKHKDNNGSIYVLNVYENGTLTQVLMNKDLWLEVMKKWDNC